MKKGQLSTEYTILLSIGFVIALFTVYQILDISFMGDKTPKGPNDIKLESMEIGVSEYSFSNYGGKILLKNNLDKLIEIDRVYVDDIDCEIESFKLDSGDHQEIDCAFLILGTEYEYDVRIEYSDIFSAYNYIQYDQDVKLMGYVSNGIDTDPAALITEIIVGTGMTGGGVSNSVSIGIDPTYWQRRVNESCASGESIKSIYENGSVVCESLSSESLWANVSDNATFSSGRVGIGTTTPFRKLDVRGGSDTAIYGETTTATGVSGWATTTTGTNYGGYFQSNSNAGVGVRAIAFAATGTTYAIYADANSADGYGIYSGSGKNYFSGNVGIGDETPTEGKLVVRDSGSIPAIYARGSIASQYISYVYNDDTTGHGIRTAVSGNGYGIYTSASGADGYGIYSADGKNYFAENVGIGTSSPGEKLEVSGNINATGDVCTTGGNCLTDIEAPTKEFFIMADPSNSDGGVSELGTNSEWHFLYLGGAGRINFVFKIPDDFNSLTNISMVLIPDATETIQFDLYSNYASAGETRTTHTGSSLDATTAVTLDELTEVDVSAVFSSLSAGDYVGFRFESDTASIRVLGLKVKYT